MNREAYLKELAGYLKKLPKDEYQKAMEYFEEYFAEAGPGHEAEAIQSLGTPREAADGILGEITLRRIRNTDDAKGQRFSTLKVVLLTLAAVPTTLLGSVLLLVAAVTVMLLLLTAILVLLAFTIVGISSAAVGIWMLTFAPASGMTMLGIGLIVTGVILLLSWFFAYVVKGIYKTAAIAAEKLIHRGGHTA